MNMDQNQFESFDLFEKSLGDSLEAISNSAPTAPQAEVIHRRLRQRKNRRIRSGIVAVVLLVSGISFYTVLPSNQSTPPTPIAMQPMITIPVPPNSQAHLPWKIPTMKLTAVSTPSLQLQDHLTADIPVSSIPPEAARVSPNISMRFVAPSVSLPNL